MIKYVNAMAMSANLRNAREQRGASEEQVINEIVKHFTDQMNQQLADELEKRFINLISTGRTDFGCIVSYCGYNGGYRFGMESAGSWINPEQGAEYKGVSLKGIANRVINAITDAYVSFLEAQGLVILRVDNYKDWYSFGKSIVVSLTEFND